MHIQSGFMSKSEEWDGITIREDYRTAHHGAGDTGYTQFLPKTCRTCRSQELEAEELGAPTPTTPDEEITL